MGVRPTGTVAFLFTDIEGSTSLWEHHDDEMNAALAAHDEILRSGVDAEDGYVFSTAGDAFAAAFQSPTAACRVALDVQARLAAHDWPTPRPIRVRMGLHVGEAHERDADFFGPAVNRAARIMSAAHGGQVLMSASCASAVGTEGLVDLGEHRLKDLGAPERLWQLNADPFPPLRTLDVARHNLPVERTPLLGRGPDIDEVVRLSAEHRLVTLLGIGGTGKTRLATAAAAELVDEAADGVWFVDLVPATSATDVVTAIASATGLHVAGSELLEALTDALSHRRMLLVLDNCEHITDDVGDVVDVLLARTVEPRFLATSREPLDLPDERHVRIEPLAIADDPASPAVELFVSAAERVGASIDGADISLVARICEGLDGLPLSIELAAGQLRQMTLDELAERLDQRFELLSRRRRGLRSRQTSLLAIVEGSWQMLDRSEQELLLQLAAFPAGFAVDDVEELWSGRAETTARLLGGLVDRGLVSRDHDGRHRLPETIKLFAREKWRDHPPSAFAETHRQWVLRRITGRTREEWYSSTDAARWGIQHYADHRAVEDHLAAEGVTDDLSQLLAGLTHAYFSEHSAQASAAVERIARFLDLLPLTDEQRALLLVVSASASLPARQQQSAERQLDTALPLLRGRADQREALTFALCIVATMRGVRATDSGLELIREARATAESAGSDVMREFAGAFRAAILALGGRIDEAIDEIADVRRRLEARSAHDYASLACDLVDVGVHVLRDPPRSRDAAERVTHLLRHIEGARSTAWPYLVVAGCAAAGAGNVAATEEWVVRTIDSATAAGEDPLPDLLVPLATLAHVVGEDDKASRWLTAVRHAPTPTHGYYVTIIYRQLRNRVVLSADDPLERTTLQAVLDEALRWMGDLAPGAAGATATA